MAGRKYITQECLPAPARQRGWKYFIQETSEYLPTYSLHDGAGHVLFTWWREPSLVDVLEKCGDLLKEEATP
jgi:hypothetical protein